MRATESDLPSVCVLSLLCRLRRSTIVTDTILDTYQLCLRLELKRKYQEEERECLKRAHAA